MTTQPSAMPMTNTSTLVGNSRDPMDAAMSFLSNMTDSLSDESIDNGQALVVNRINYVIGGIITPVICILGMIGNALAFITWNRPALRSSTASLLSSQAVVDFGVLLGSLIIISAKQWSVTVFHDKTFAIIFTYVGVPMYYYCVHCSVWLTLAVTIERYIMVCWATHSKSLCGKRQARIGIFIILLTSAIANIPHFFIYGIASSTTIGNDLKPVISVTAFGSGMGGKIYLLYISCISLIAFPWFCVLFFNYRIILQIATSNRQMLERKTSEASFRAKKTENQITRLLLAVTFTYLSVMGPYCLLQIAIIIHEKGVDPYHRSVAMSITKTGYILNSSLNFILYCMMGRRFRRELKTMLGMKLSEADMSTTYDSSTGSQKTDNSTVSGKKDQN